MPEGPEVKILSQYLIGKLRGRIISKVEILSGKYTKNEIANIKLFKTPNKYIILNVESHGKLMWFTLESKKESKKIYLVSHLGLTGQWSFYRNDDDRVKITIVNQNDDKTYYLYYNDQRNFGNIYIYDNFNHLKNKTNALAPDVLEVNITENEFIKKIKKYNEGKKKDRYIFVVLMDQTIKSGLFSGLGNYLTPEILYNAKISPFTKMKSLSDSKIKTLLKSIKYITKLSYYNNTTGYMSNFGEYIANHKKKIDNGKIPDYHPEIKLSDISKLSFKFSVYGKKVDPFGNTVERDKTINKGRSVYWVPSVQK